LFGRSGRSIHIEPRRAAEVAAVFPEYTHAGCTFGLKEFGGSVELTMIAHGWALEDVPPTDREFYRAFHRPYADVEAEARRARRGMWALACTPTLRH
jgi:endonuclease YncB( thermonuclease family)